MSLFNLKNKSILITGSSRGIGKSIALHSAMHGAKVIISSRKIDACIETANEINKEVGDEVAYPIPCNISDSTQLIELVSKTIDLLGGILSVCLSVRAEVCTSDFLSLCVFSCVVVCL